MEITTKEFLIGGVRHNPSMIIDGFHCLTKADEFQENFETFETYKKTVKELLEDYGWNTEENMTVDRCDADQIFNMPIDSVIQVWFNEFKCD